MTSVMKVDSITKSDGTAGVHIAGHVIQTVFHSSATVVTYSGSTMQTFGMSKSFTPKFSDSIIWLIVTIAGEHYGYSDLGVRYYINQDSTVLYDSQYTHYHSSDSSQNISQHTMQWYGNAGSTSARNYSVTFRPSNPSGTARVNNYGEPSYMTIMEIAQ
tara:strand:+ start:3559 stop:4035 length:477 start_codon:yes stop_codon:yes gene_type:complete